MEIGQTIFWYNDNKVCGPGKITKINKDLIDVKEGSHTIVLNENQCFNTKNECEDFLKDFKSRMYDALMELSKKYGNKSKTEDDEYERKIDIKMKNVLSEIYWDVF